MLTVSSFKHKYKYFILQALIQVLIFLCTMKSRSSLLAPAHPGGPGKRAVNGCCGGGDDDDRSTNIGLRFASTRQVFHLTTKLYSSIIKVQV